MPEGFPFWMSYYDVGQVGAPPSEASLKELIDTLETTLPQDYTELLSLANGLTLDQKLCIYSINDVHDVVLEDGTYHVIGEILGEAVFLMLKVSSTESVIFYTEHDSGEVQNIGRSIEEAAEMLLK